VDEIRKQGGIHFDPELVEHFMTILPGVHKIGKSFSEP